ncbi:MAG: glycosyltransferase [Proteobacteria bacterium]|nr:glycosyltransferase [Pseudomonadota bacterium]
MTSASKPDSALRILHIGKYFPPHLGGMETYLRDLMVASASMGAQPMALVHQSHFGVRSSEEAQPGKHSKIVITRAATWFRLLYTPVSPVFPWLLHRLIKQYQPDVLHLHLPNPSAFWALLLPSARRLPWVIHWQSDVLTPRSHWLLKIAYVLYAPFESALLRKAATIIATSPPYLNTSKPLGKVRSKCEVVPLGIADPFDHVPADRGSHTVGADSTAPASPPKPLRVLAVGRMAHYKGFDVLLHAVASVQQVQLDLVGKGEQAVSLEGLAASLGIADRVRFHGALDDGSRDELLSTCDCLCLPSTDRTESFGVVILEAMSAAKSCLVSDVAGSGMGWLVDQGRTGLVVPSNDMTALADALCRLRDDPALTHQLGRNGREKFLRSFTIEASVRAIHNIYRELVGSR